MFLKFQHTIQHSTLNEGSRFTLGSSLSLQYDCRIYKVWVVPLNMKSVQIIIEVCVLFHNLLVEVDKRIKKILSDTEI